MRSTTRRLSRLSVFVSALFLTFGGGYSSWAGDEVRLYYEENAQVELVSSAGTRVVIDVLNPEKLSKVPSANDILLITNDHQFFYNRGFCESFPGEQFKLKSGEMRFKGGSVRSIASARHEDDPLTNESGTNYIMIVEMGDLRIAHFGYIGPNALTPGQLAALGQVDVAILPLAAHFGLTVANMSAFNIVDQVKPRLVIPTFIYELAASEVAVKQWTGYNSRKNYITLSADTMPESTTIVFMGANAYFEKLPPSPF